MKILGLNISGSTAGPGQTPLPDDLEQAAVEQVAYLFQNRDKLGLKTYWPSGDIYKQFATQDLLASVSAILRTRQRVSLMLPVQPSSIYGPFILV